MLTKLSQLLSTLNASFKATTRKITTSKLVLFYFSFSLLYCVIQTALSARAFIDYSGPDRTLSTIATLGNARDLSIPIYNGTHLVLCASERTEANYTCSVVWDGSPKVNQASSPIVARAGASEVNVALQGIDMVLDRSCLLSLNFPIFEMDHSKRESVAFLCFQVWVFLMSMIAVTNESIPHILASLLMHILVFGWGIFQLVHSLSFEQDYREIIVEGACRGVSLLPDLFNIRRRTEIPIAVINFLALLVAAVLTWKLIKILNWRNFKTSGANLRMNRHRKIMLILFITVQLAFFFIVVFSALFLDLLVKGNLRISASFPVLYKTAAGLSIVGTVPWLVAGRYAIQLEHRFYMFLFLAWALIWPCWFFAMFFSTSFTQELLHWPFMATVGIAAAVSSTVAFFLGVICRFNFGKGFVPSKGANAAPRVKSASGERYVWDVENSPYFPDADDAVKFPSPRSFRELPQFSSPQSIPPPIYSLPARPMPTP